MKKTLFYVVGFLAALTLTFSFFTACDFTALRNLSDSLEVIVELKPIETSVVGKFLDASTGDFLDEPVHLTFYGQRADAIIDLYSDPVTQLEVTGGLTSFGISNTLIPSPGNLVQFNVVAAASGYERTNAPILIDSHGEFRFDLYMASSARPPRGAVATENKTGQVTHDGFVIATYEVVTPGGPASGIRAIVTVPSGTELLDENRRGLTGQISTRLLYFNTQSLFSLRSFPGGFSTLLRTDNGSHPGTLVTGGFLSIEIMDENKREAITSSAPINVSLEIPGNTIFPKMGRFVQEGDPISVWSYDVEEGVWTKESEVVLAEPLSSGHYMVPFDLTHFSWWNVGWESDTCMEGAVVNIERNGNLGSLSSRLVAGGYLKMYRLLEGFNRIVLTEAPEHLSGSLIFSLEGGPYSVDIPDVCNSTQLVHLPKPPGLQMTVTFRIVPLCPPGMGIPIVGEIPTFAIVYRNAMAVETEWQDVTGNILWVDDGREMLYGELTIPGLSEGVTYIFKSTYSGYEFSKTVSITGPEMTIQFDEVAQYCR